MSADSDEQWWVAVWPATPPPRQCYAQVFAAAGAFMQGQIFVFISFVTLTAAASKRVVQCSAVRFFYLFILCL